MQTKILLRRYSFCLFCLVLFFVTGFLREALADLELVSYVDQAGSKGMCHCLVTFLFNNMRVIVGGFVFVGLGLTWIFLHGKRSAMGQASLSA